METDSTLTEQLLGKETDKFYAATQHPFLKHAGQGTCSQDTLTEWLIQDTYYTRAYVRFLGSMLARLDLPFSLRNARSYGGLTVRIFNLVTSALTNIQREMAFFESTAEEYGINLRADTGVEPPRTEATKEYQRLFSTVCRGENVTTVDLLQGLVLLWSTEHVYLTAWRYARAQSLDAKPTNAASRALHEQFIPNWTSKEFETFVNECGDVLDEFAELLGVYDPKSHMRQGCETIWTKVLEIEAAFWPTMA